MARCWTCISPTLSFLHEGTLRLCSQINKSDCKNGLFWIQLSRAVMMEVEPPSILRYLIGSAIMMLGVVLPLGYMMFRNKRAPSSSSYSKQT
ncbi:uncharacterized protein [Primulina eburnea]